MIRVHQESLTIKAWLEHSQGSHQTEHFPLSHALPTLCLDQRAACVQHNLLRFSFSLSQHRSEAVFAGVQVRHSTDVRWYFNVSKADCQTSDQPHSDPVSNSRCNGAAVFARPLTNLQKYAILGSMTPAPGTAATLTHKSLSATLTMHRFCFGA
ncbi:hypothetical protein T03_13835 [Trichinella britovi]|uniref:Uncharacterized protein n=1 Tax=Trichinella britovi TaxID=45882 RepID=A0A0V1DEM4_TRIBR|nr:hypothetical protein T03_13835 [Trichinella britovi]